MSTKRADHLDAIPSTLKAISFDIGDTLIFDRPNRRERLVSALSVTGIEFAEPDFLVAYAELEREGLRRYVVGESLDNPKVAFELTLRLLRQISDSQNLVQLAKRALESYMKTPFERYVHSEAVPVITDLYARGFKLGVISDWEADLPILLQKLDLLKYFETTSISEVVGVTKPSSKLFRDALTKLNVNPDECLHVGDFYELDVIGARSVGMHALLFDLQGRYVGKDLDVLVASTFAELATYLKGVELPQ